MPNRKVNRFDKIQFEAEDQVFSKRETLGEICISIAKDFHDEVQVNNARFDYIYPSLIRRLSPTHWTPVDVALKAAKLLVSSPKTKVLDIGSGCGKFCTIGGLATSAKFIGVEQRASLVEVALNTIDNFHLSNVSFIHANMMDLDWSIYDAFYLFNPFYENLMHSNWVDNEGTYNEERFNFYIETVQSKLKALKKGTRVVTYHGFGGAFPSEYECTEKELIGTSMVDLWVKT